MGWVRFPNLPLNCWSSDSLSKIGNLVGVPLCADECTTRQLRVSFARLLIEVSVTKELPKSVFIQDGSGLVVEQVVKFEWAPSFCQACQKVGHNCKVAKPKKMVKKWVPKVPAATVNEGTEEPQSVGNVTDVAAEPSGVSTPAPIPAEDKNNAGWRTVTRPSKGRKDRPSLPVVEHTNSYLTLIEETSEMGTDEDSVSDIDGGDEQGQVIVSNPP